MKITVSVTISIKSLNFIAKFTHLILLFDMTNLMHNFIDPKK